MSVNQSTAQQEIEKLSASLKQNSGFDQKSYAVTSTWASKLGHPCGERWLYYLRTQWEQMAKRDWKGRGIKGDLIHSWWRTHMMQKGYEVVQNESPLSEKLRNLYGIGGRIDGRIGGNGMRPILYEFKTMNPVYYDKINSVQDMLDHPKDYIKAYPAQIQLYQIDKNEEGALFVICNADTLEWKVLPSYLDYGYTEYLLKRAEAVKKAYDQNVEGNPFKRIPYGSTCKSCDFAHICLPDIINEGLPLVDDAHLEDILKERAQCQDDAERWGALDKEAKEIASTVGKDFIVGTSFSVRVKKTMGTRLDTKAIPQEIAAQYQKPTETMRIEFVPLDLPK